MFCLLYICKTAKENENQTEINQSNQSNQISLLLERNSLILLLQFSACLAPELGEQLL